MADLGQEPLHLGLVVDDVQTVAGAVLAHRVVLKGGSGSIEAARAAIERVVDSMADSLILCRLALPEQWGLKWLSR